MASSLPQEVLERIFWHVAWSYPEPTKEIFFLDCDDNDAASRHFGVSTAGPTACVRPDAGVKKRSGVLVKDDLFLLDRKGQLWHPQSRDEPLRVWSRVSRRFRHLAIPHIFQHVVIDSNLGATGDTDWTGPDQGVWDYGNHPFRQLRALRTTFAEHLSHVRSFAFHHFFHEMWNTGEDDETIESLGNGLDPRLDTGAWQEYVDLLVWLLTPGQGLPNLQSVALASHMTAYSAVRAAVLARDVEDFVAVDLGQITWNEPVFHLPFFSRFHRCSFTKVSSRPDGCDPELFEALASPECINLQSLIINFELSEVREMLAQPRWVVPILRACARIELKLLWVARSSCPFTEDTTFAFALCDLHNVLADRFAATKTRTSGSVIKPSDVEDVADDDEHMQPIAQYLRAHADDIAEAFNESLEHRSVKILGVLD